MTPPLLNSWTTNEVRLGRFRGSGVGHSTSLTDPVLRLWFVHVEIEINLNSPFFTFFCLPHFRRLPLKAFFASFMLDV